MQQTLEAAEAEEQEDELFFLVVLRSLIID